jgi:hypothetical protein
MQITLYGNQGLESLQLFLGRKCATKNLELACFRASGFYESQGGKGRICWVLLTLNIQDECDFQCHVYWKHWHSL